MESSDDKPHECSRGRSLISAGEGGGAIQIVRVPVCTIDAVNYVWNVITGELGHPVLPPHVAWAPRPPPVSFDWPQCTSFYVGEIIKVL